MAEQKDDIDINPGKSKKKLLLGIIILVILAVAGLAAAYFLSGDDNDAESTETAEAPKAAPIYYDVKDPFIVNFGKQSNDAVRYLQVKLKVMARNQQAIDDFVAHEPAIIHELLLLFFSQNYDDLNTSEGTRELQQATLKTINQQLATLADNQQGLEAVYFTSLVMQ
ncbi:MAG TPA: flagellar basal body-associated FliL family protein [Methylotenera sp.]|nr:flagellar basal body-associated FliL family protein [Methylotenera sp.]